MLCVGNSSVVKIYIIRPKPGPVAKNATPRPFGWESNPCGFDSQPEILGVAFFATGPGLGLIMYIFTTLEFPTHNIDFNIFETGIAQGLISDAGIPQGLIFLRLELLRGSGF